MKKSLIKKEYLVGIFVVFILATTYFGLMFLKNQRIFSGDNIIYAKFPSADGLEESAPVVVKGFRIGTVKKITFNIETQEVVVMMHINEEYELPVDSKAKIASLSILGGKKMEVELGKNKTVFIKTGDIMQSSNDRAFMDSAADEYEKLKTVAVNIVNKVDSVLSGVNRIVSEKNTANLSAIIENLQSISAEINSVTKTQSGKIKNIISNLETLSATLKNSTPELQRGITNFAAITDTLNQNMPTLINQATQSIENLNSILKKVNNGDGTAGKLVNDEQMYDNLNKTVESLNALLTDLKANPKRYVKLSLF